MAVPVINKDLLSKQWRKFKIYFQDIVRPRGTVRTFRQLVRNCFYKAKNDSLWRSEVSEILTLLKLADTKQQLRSRKKFQRYEKNFDIPEIVTK